MNLKVGTKFNYNDLVPIKQPPHPFLEPFEVISINRSNSKPNVSVIIPVFNKERIVCSMLDNLIASLTTNYELIIIDDASSDNSKEIITNYLKNKDIRHVFISTSVPIFETACDNLGFFIAEGFYLLEIQSDMIIHDKGFDKRMIDALNNNKFSSVSGRSCHSWFDVLGPKLKIISILKLKSSISLFLFGTGEKGYVGKNLYDNILVGSPLLGEVYEADTNCRGPWLINKYLLNTIGPLDTDKFFQGYDDLDFNLRGSELGFRSGYTPIIMTCDPKESSGKQNKNNVNKKIFEYLSNNKLIHQVKPQLINNEFIKKILDKKCTRPLKIKIVKH
jgi:glycosyltransferase involved in cell wall biosynthesis